MVVDYDQFKLLSVDFEMRKNPSLYRYEIKFQKFDIDVYTLFYSKLTVPPEDLINNYTLIENIRVPRVEELLTNASGNSPFAREGIKANEMFWYMDYYHNYALRTG